MYIWLTVVELLQYLKFFTNQRQQLYWPIFTIIQKQLLGTQNTPQFVCKWQLTQKKVLFKLILRKGSKGLIQGLEMSMSPCHFKSKSLYQLNYTFTLTVSFGKYWLSQWSLHLSIEPANQTYPQWECPSEGDRRSIFALRLNYESWKQKSTNWEL